MGKFGNLGEYQSLKSRSTLLQITLSFVWGAISDAETTFERIEQESGIEGTTSVGNAVKDKVP